VTNFGDIQRQTRRVLKEAGISGYNTEARVLCEYASGFTREEYVKNSHMIPQNARFEKLLLSYISRRLDGEPLAYITGNAEFYGLQLNVSRETLIPRIDTEVVVDRAVQILRRFESPRVLDLCTGCGCIGCAIAFSVPNARVTLADVSDEALSVARKNIKSLNLTRRVSTAAADALKHAPALRKFDLIVCNPPYIPTEEIALLDKEVRCFEPLIALDGGADGLDFYRAVAAKWRILLDLGSYLLFEVGYNQCDDVMKILAENGYSQISCTKDTQGIRRAVEGVLPFVP